MNAPIRSGISELAGGLCWRPSENVAMIWAYYDESGEYADGKLLNMSIGGCVSSLAKWELFKVDWCATLQAEGLSYFHMTDFEAWKSPYDFKLPDGSRDNEKHRRLIAGLLSVMLDYVECFAAFSAGNLVSPDGSLAHGLAMEDCVLGAVTHAIHDLWDRYQEPINLVFGKQRHFSYAKIMRYVEFNDWGKVVGALKPWLLMSLKTFRSYKRPMFSRMKWGRSSGPPARADIRSTRSFGDA